MVTYSYNIYHYNCTNCANSSYQSCYPLLWLLRPCVHSLCIIYILQCQNCKLIPTWPSNVFTAHHFLFEFHHIYFYPSQCEVQEAHWLTLVFVFTALKYVFVLTLKIKVKISFNSILISWCGSCYGANWFTNQSLRYFCVPVYLCAFE